VNTLRGSFYSTAFRVRNEGEFEADPVIRGMRMHMDMFAGRRHGSILYCIASKDTRPPAPLEVFAPAILGLLADARPGVAVEDSLGWIGALQRHLDPGSGIVIDETAGNERFMTYITADRAGRTRRNPD
jgi:hypothetical protein